MESQQLGDANSIPIVRPEGLMLVLNTTKGRGLFASRDIPAYTVVEIAPVLVLDPVENENHVRKTDLFNYTYNWPYEGQNLVAGSCKTPLITQAVVFGLGSLFNHSRRSQNIGWTRDIQRKVIIYKTLREVKKGDELCISYGDRLTFVDTDAVSDSEDDENGGLGKMELE